MLQKLHQKDKDIGKTIEPISASTLKSFYSLLSASLPVTPPLIYMNTEAKEPNHSNFSSVSSEEKSYSNITDRHHLNFYEKQLNCHEKSLRRLSEKLKFRDNRSRVNFEPHGSARTVREELAACRKKSFNLGKSFFNTYFNLARVGMRFSLKGVLGIPNETGGTGKS